VRIFVEEIQSFAMELAKSCGRGRIFFFSERVAAMRFCSEKEAEFFSEKESLPMRVHHRSAPVELAFATCGVFLAAVFAKCT
jgi:hypothetical protein